MSPTTGIKNKTIELDISKDGKKTVLLNVENEVRELINRLANKKAEVASSDIIDGDEEKESILNGLPNSMTGVLVHYLCRGVKQDFDIEFKEQPVSLKLRGGSNYDKKVAGKKRLLTKQQKNELLACLDFKYYTKGIEEGKMTMNDALECIKKAYQQKEEYEKMGYVLPEKKTESPFWRDEEE